MHSELIRALSMAVLVGIVPGYFWARWLVYSADHAERIAYSVTLVPTAALLLAGLFDTGVTLVVAAVSVSTVFVTGLAAYLWFGPPTSTDRSPLASSPPPPGVHALIPLVAAFGVVLATAVGFIPEARSMPSVALLLVLAGAVYPVESRRAAPKSSREPPRGALADRWPAILRALVVAAVLALTVVRGYLGPIKHDWPYLRGGDQFSHAVMTNLMTTEGEIEPYLIYPPGFHTLTALLSRLSRLEPLEIFPGVGPRADGFARALVLRAGE